MIKPYRHAPRRRFSGADEEDKPKHNLQTHGIEKPSVVNGILEEIFIAPAERNLRSYCLAGKRPNQDCDTVGAPNRRAASQSWTPFKTSSHTNTMFTHSYILSRTIQIIGNHARTTVAKDSTISGLSIDSLSAVEIVMELEEEFQIDLNEKVAATFRDSTPFAIAFAIASAIIDELAADGTEVEKDAAPISFRDMVAGLVKPGEAIVAEMSASKSICLATAMTAALRVSRQVDKAKKYVVYGKENPEDGVAHSQVSIGIGHMLTPSLAHKLHMAVGLFGEAGEILEAVVAEVETGVRDTPNEIEESGDLEFYHEGYRQACGFSREEAIAANIEKLGKRYLGHKYTDAQAIARADKSSDAHESPRAFEPQSSADADSRDIFNR